jgi:dTDP-4-amino-4,6-dideoxygalactose transaminase
VFDPVRETAIPYRFYRTTPALAVDVDHFADQVEAHPGAAVLLIHYFGRVDPSYRVLIDLVQASGGELIEDEAHAALTDLAGGHSGRGGKHAFLSWHKFLPVAGGGARIINGPGLDRRPSLLPELQTWDFQGIARARIRNFEILADLLGPHQDLVQPLWSRLEPGEVPQTFPVLLHPADGTRTLRDQVYDRMNQLGFGVVSLYHTLISELEPTLFPASFFLADRILNLPVHQDVPPGRLPALVEALVAQIRCLGEARG